MKLRATVLAALTMVGLIVLISPASPAWACSCVAAGQDERADLIVVGTVTRITDVGVRMAVESVEKGGTSGTGTVDLSVGRSGSSCGYEFRTGVRYRVNSTEGRTGLCSGVRELPPRPSPPPTTARGTAPPVAAEPVPASDNRWWVAGGLTAAVLLAGFGIAIVRRRRAD